MKTWIALAVALMLAPQLADAAQKKNSKAEAARAAFERMDREDFLDGLEEADACTRRLDFGCAQRKLAEIQPLIATAEQERLWQQAGNSVQYAAQQQQQRLAQQALERQRAAQAQADSGFQWGKLAAVGAGMALGGVGELDSATQAELLLGAVRDSMPNQEGMSGLQAAAASSSQRINGGGGGMGGAMGGAGGKGNWTPEPNILNGSAACSGYTDSNFKQHFQANSKGNDVQLHTLCAGAYNYYSMYLNAKRQGYSKQEAQVTYNAFLDAARVAEDFYARTRTN